jgi:hypothetical protein
VPVPQFHSHQSITSSSCSFLGYVWSYEIVATGVPELALPRSISVLLKSTSGCGPCVDLTPIYKSPTETSTPTTSNPKRTTTSKGATSCRLVSQPTTRASVLSNTSIADAERSFEGFRSPCVSLLLGMASWTPIVAPCKPGVPSVACSGQHLYTAMRSTPAYQTCLRCRDYLSTHT